MSEHQHHDRPSHAAVIETPHVPGDGPATLTTSLAMLELEITNYFMGSTCPNIEEHVGATAGVHSVYLNRTTGIMEVAYDSGRVTPDTIIEAVKYCGFICREGGPVHKASRPGSAHAEHVEMVGDEEHDAHASADVDRLSHLGVLLRPEWATLAMAASTITVTINALLLKQAGLPKAQNQMKAPQPAVAPAVA